MTTAAVLPPAARRAASARTAPVRTAGTRQAGDRVSPASAGRTWRLTRRGRMTLGAMLSVPFVAVLMLLGSATADAGSTATVGAPATQTVVVQAGESLWQIAQTVAPGADPRATITTIRELNGLGERAVVPGQALIVPTAS